MKVDATRGKTTVRFDTLTPGAVFECGPYSYIKTARDAAFNTFNYAIEAIPGPTGVVPCPNAVLVLHPESVTP